MNVIARDITKTFKDATVLDHVTVQIPAGRVTGLWGINGSGKTMLMRIICGLVRPTSGEVLFDRKVLGRDLAHPLSTGALIEGPALLANRTGFENLRLIGMINGTATDRDIRRAIAQVGLDPNERKKFKKYSLGMKQRLGIAAAVFEKPDLVILDEPTNALDTSGVEMVKRVVAAERERGAAVLMACHDKSVLDAVADHVYSMEAGRVVREEDPQ